MLKYTKIIKAIRKIDWFVNKPSIYIDGMTSYKKMKECFIKKIGGVPGGWYNGNGIYIVDSAVRINSRVYYSGVSSPEVFFLFFKIYLIIHELSHAQQKVNFKKYEVSKKYRNFIEFSNDSKSLEILEKNKAIFINMANSEFKKDVSFEFESLIEEFKSRFNKPWLYEKREDLW